VSLVIDSSITLAWFFEDERSNAADAVLSDVADHGAIDLETDLHAWATTLQLAER
jgi:hypothetical protein